MGRLCLEFLVTGSGWKIRDANNFMAFRAFNLAAGKLNTAFQRLFTVGAVKFQFVRFHGFYL